MPHSTTNFKPSLFDRAFVDVIEFLAANRKHIQKFTTKKALLEELDIAPANYVEIKNSHRGVPTRKIEDIIDTLTKDWNINSHYLKFREGDITKTPLGISEEKQRQNMSAIERISILEKDLEKERAINTELRAMIKLQKEMLDRFKPAK